MTRARGLATWSPQRETLEVLEQVNTVLAEYREHLPLTIRQIFYRLVGTRGYDKTEKAYARLAEYLNRARRAGMVKFEHVRDDGITSESPGGYSSAKNFWWNVGRWAKNFKLDRLDGQDSVVEIWVEAAGMVPQIARVAHPYGITVYSSGGFNSTTAKYETAKRLEGQDAVVLHIGDLDPSGVAMFDSLEDDIREFLRDLSSTGFVQFERVVLTPEQMERYSLPTAPPKKTDPRSNYQGETAQAEALPPDILADEVRNAILEHIDEDVWNATVERETGERDALLKQIKELSL
jgi:hypothetical protein